MRDFNLKLKNHVLAKIEARDFIGLNEFLERKSREDGPEAAMRWMRVSILADLGRDDCIWFWQQAMSDDFPKTLERIFSTCTGILDHHPLVSSDSWYDTEDSDGNPLLWVSPEAYRALLDALPPERHGVLPMIIQHIPAPRRLDDGLQKTQRTTLRGRLRHRDSPSFAEELARATGMEAGHFIRT